VDGEKNRSLGEGVSRRDPEKLNRFTLDMLALNISNKGKKR
jgi:hypothetical protein